MLSVPATLSSLVPEGEVSCQELQQKKKKKKSIELEAQT